MRYENARESIPEIAAALNVDAIMECTARYSGDEVMLTANLIDGQSDTNHWSNRYPENLSDIRILFEIQADIAMNVANALAVEFLAGEIDELERLPTGSREAYELYLAATADRLRDGTMGGMQRTVEFYNYSFISKSRRFGRGNSCSRNCNRTRAVKWCGLCGTGVCSECAG
jgi:hypothetical protein